MRGKLYYRGEFVKEGTILSLAAYVAHKEKQFGDSKLQVQWCLTYDGVWREYVFRETKSQVITFEKTLNMTQENWELFVKNSKCVFKALQEDWTHE